MIFQNDKYKITLYRHWTPMTSMFFEILDIGDKTDDYQLG